MLDSVYGITMFGGDARFHNLTIEAPDRVGIDLFGATPVFEDLIVNDAGQNAFQTDWRFGLGLSVGSGSAPVVKRATFSGVTTRGLNIWVVPEASSKTSAWTTSPALRGLMLLGSGWRTASPCSSG